MNSNYILISPENIIIFLKPIIIEENPGFDLCLFVFFELLVPLIGLSKLLKKNKMNS